MCQELKAMESYIKYLKISKWKNFFKLIKLSQRGQTSSERDSHFYIEFYSKDVLRSRVLGKGN
jgi:hypothetical protein